MSVDYAKTEPGAVGGSEMGGGNGCAGCRGGGEDGLTSGAGGGEAGRVVSGARDGSTPVGAVCSTGEECAARGHQGGER